MNADQLDFFSVDLMAAQAAERVAEVIGILADGAKLALRNDLRSARRNSAEGQ